MVVEQKIEHCESFGDQVDFKTHGCEWYELDLRRL
jgi:hypothetical protein